MQSLKKGKKNQENKGKVWNYRHWTILLNKIFPPMLRLVWGYNVYRLIYIYLYIKNIKQKRGTILPAYSTILEKTKSSLFSTLAIFDMTTELFSSTVCSFFHRSVDWTINRSSFQKSLLILAKKNQNKRMKVEIKKNIQHRRKRVLALYSAQARKASPKLYVQLRTTPRATPMTPTMSRYRE